MANTHLLEVFYLVFVSLSIASSAYNSAEFTQHIEYGSEPTIKAEKPDLGYEHVSKPNLEKTEYAPTPKAEKPKLKKPELGYEHIPKHDLQKPDLQKPEYAPTPKVEKPKLKKPELGYQHIPKHDLKKPEYAPTPKVEKPKLEKPELGYEHNPKHTLEKPGYAPTPKVSDVLKGTIGIQGLVYCRSGVKLIPIEGAVVRVTCLAVSKNGYESAPFSILTKPTDKKGYFFTEVVPSLISLECKVFLSTSPLRTCNIPTDINKGVTGALINGPPHHLIANKLNLYSVGPFIYTADPNTTVSKGY